MAGFVSHVSVSGATGAAFGVFGYACGLPPTTAAVGACACTLGGMLPDLDGDTGIAVREIVPLVAAAVPIMMMDIFKTWGFDREMMFLAIIGLYFAIRFGIGEPFKRLTRHRGMWHSIPAAINVGLICFLVCSYQDLGARVFKASAITLGFLSHLILDEIYSLGWFRMKRSAGTAFKFFTRNRVWPNVLTYAILIALVSIIWFKDATFQQDLQARREAGHGVFAKPDWSRFSSHTSEQKSSDGERAERAPEIAPNRAVESAAAQP